MFILVLFDKLQFVVARKSARKRTKYCPHSYQLILNTYLFKKLNPFEMLA